MSEIEVGQRVITFFPYARYGEQPQVLTIESVAPKSFVVGGQRYRKDKMEHTTHHSSYDSVTVRVVTLDDDRAPWLLAVRLADKAHRQVLAAEKAWRVRQVVSTAADLQVALHGWVIATEEVGARLSALKILKPKDWTK